MRRCWAQIDLDALSQNAAAIRRRLSDGCRLMAVVKADAYGHGDRQVAAHLSALAPDAGGADWFGVSNLEEALSLRQSGIQKPILILGFTPALPRYARLLADECITQTVFSGPYAAELAAAAKEAGVTLDIHIKVDTGMTRLGFAWDDAASYPFVKALYANPAFRPTGIYTHFASADEKTPDGQCYTQSQYDRFAAFCQKLQADGVDPGLRHCCNSAGAILCPNDHMDMVRVGIALYGLYPAPSLQNDIALVPVMNLLAAVSMVKPVKAGIPVSYGRTFTPDHDIVAATLPVGYADGYTRDLSGKASVLLRGRLAPVIGRVCMDQLMVDVTHIPDVSPGDVAVIAGRNIETGEKAISFDELAAFSGTIGYEKICLVGKRVSRVYLKDGQMIGKASFYPDFTP